jgi:hypothetical protein
MSRILVFIVVSLFSLSVLAQKKPIRIVEEKTNNRLLLYAYNESEIAYDVKMTVTGTNFRQSRATPRFIRVPAASKVHMWTLIPMRDKKADYTYTLDVNDSLSSRSLQKEYERIRIDPGKQIVLYLPAACAGCDSLINSMSRGHYNYTSFHLPEHPEIRQQLQQVFGDSSPIDSLKTPIVNLGGILHTNLGTYAEIMEALKEK